MLFITYYEIIGSRCNGTYLVNATSKKQSNQIVKAIDVDYCRVRSLTPKEFGETDWVEFIEGVIIPEEGKVIHLECGT